MTIVPQRVFRPLKPDRLLGLVHTQCFDSSMSSYLAELMIQCNKRPRQLTALSGWHDRWFTLKAVVL
jgi:hypothetical protein